MANDPIQRQLAAENNVIELQGSGAYTTIYHNLQWATPGEIIWSKDANGASLRAAARMPGDREVNGVFVNPFWYHSEIIAE